MTPPVLVPAAEPVTLTLDAGDALQAGLTMVSLAMAGRCPNPIIADVFERVGRQLSTAARAHAKSVGR